MVNTNQLGVLAKLKLVESLAELALPSLYGGSSYQARGFGSV